jgi:hypothetical protein
VGWSAADNRRPLGSKFGARFLNGGVFSGGTHLLVWRDPKAPSTPVSCAATQAWYPLGQEEIMVFDEAEDVTSAGGFPFPAVTNDVAVNGSALPVPYPFGWLYLNLHQQNPASTGNPSIDPAAAQNWVGYQMDANGRFSVGQRAVVLEGVVGASHTCLDGSSTPCP